MAFPNITPLQGLFLIFVTISTNIYAALPLKKAAEQQNICSQLITGMSYSCRAAKYQINKCFTILPDNSDFISRNENTEPVFESHENFK